MMSRSLGRKDYDTVCRSSAFGFYSSVLAGTLFFALLFALLQHPLLSFCWEPAGDGGSYRRPMPTWTVVCGATPAIPECGDGLYGARRGAALHASMAPASGCLLKHCAGPRLYSSLGACMGAEGRGLPPSCPTVACQYFFVLLFVKRKNTYKCRAARHVPCAEGRVCWAYAGWAFPRLFRIC